MKRNQLLLGAMALAAVQAALAQTAPDPAAAAAPTTTPPAVAPPAAPAPPAQKVEITGGRESDADQRRQSTAAKIIIGREEIERFGDSTVGEILKRLPGVTSQGPPGRGGPPRMRGLGAGYTQILIDGQRVPPGFSIESLTPEQLERIEILRAPTAETGARAIGGTINIITREGFTRRLNDVRLGFGYENGRASPGVSWTHNDTAGNLIYNLSASAFRGQRDSSSTTTTTDEDLTSGATTREQVERNRTRDQRVGLNVTSRLQWRGEGGDMLMLMPVLFHTQAQTQRTFALNQRVGSTPALYDHGDSGGDSHFTVGRLNGQWRHTLGDGLRLELNGGAGLSRGASNSLRHELDSNGGLLRTISDDIHSQERTATLNVKASKLLASEHSIVTGAELESARRTETRITLQDGLPQLTDFGDDVSASNLRLAAYAQDEWNISPNWAAHAGLRWEGITTRGDTGDGSSPRNHSSVATPLLHAVWKPDPKVRDQLRFSLTRSYKSPTLQNLVARPSINSRYPTSGANTPTSPDRAGNPALQPELATGIDIAAERYLDEGGVLSANVFYRRIKNYMRSVTALETVSWSPFQRYVSRPQNIGDAMTRGLELEAKFTLDQAIAGAPRVEIRSNLSLFNSKVEQVPGPDNRLDQQPKGTANFGADYRFRGTPLTIGGSLNWTPGFRTQVSEIQAIQVSTKRQFDAFALWVFSPTVQLRLNATNLNPNDYLSTNTLDTGSLREIASTLSPTYINWQLRLELKL